MYESGTALRRCRTTEIDELASKSEAKQAKSNFLLPRPFMWLPPGMD